MGIMRRVTKSKLDFLSRLKILIVSRFVEGIQNTSHFLFFYGRINKQGDFFSVNLSSVSSLSGALYGGIQALFLDVLMSCV